MAKRTIPLDKKFGLKRSLDSPSLARLISVSATYLAFLENHSVATMTIPDTNNKKVGVGTFLAKMFMLNSAAGIPDMLQAS